MNKNKKEVNLIDPLQGFMKTLTEKGINDFSYRKVGKIDLLKINLSKVEDCVARLMVSCGRNHKIKTVLPGEKYKVASSNGGSFLLNIKKSFDKKFLFIGVTKDITARVA